MPVPGSLHRLYLSMIACAVEGFVSFGGQRSAAVVHRRDSSEACKACRYPAYDHPLDSSYLDEAPLLSSREGLSSSISSVSDRSPTKSAWKGGRSRPSWSSSRKTRPPSSSVRPSSVGRPRRAHPSRPVEDCRTDQGLRRRPRRVCRRLRTGHRRFLRPPTYPFPTLHRTEADRLPATSSGSDQQGSSLWACQLPWLALFLGRASISSSSEFQPRSWSRVSQSNLSPPPLSLKINDRHRNDPHQAPDV